MIDARRLRLIRVVWPWAPSEPVTGLPPPWDVAPEVVVCVLVDEAIEHPAHGWCPGITHADDR